MLVLILSVNTTGVGFLNNEGAGTNSQQDEMIWFDEMPSILIKAIPGSTIFERHDIR